MAHVVTARSERFLEDDGPVTAATLIAGRVRGVKNSFGFSTVGMPFGLR